MKKKILIVEDEEDVLTVETIRLEKSGYEVFSAKNGHEGIALAQKIHPDLIFLDLLIPQMRGEEICRELKGNPETKDIPVVFITASQVEKVEQKVIMNGAQAYIIKPFETEELMAVVKRFTA